jgi:radical SAM enzyme (TIGR01210 family)
MPEQTLNSVYPETDRERDRWILDRRPARGRLDPTRACAASMEPEASESGEVVPVATIFLTNRECPWRCLMCDLWKNTLPDSVSPGDIPRQIRDALASLSPVPRVKLYNAGSFFDPNAIPRDDYATIASLLAPFERVIVESHPSLIGDRCLQFHELLGGRRLEVAMGLETVHPEVLPRLNKRMTLAHFRSAAERLQRAGIALRAFILVGLPFLGEEESLEWAGRAVESAFEWGASAVALIPTRSGNGALDDLERNGEFTRPKLATLEAAFEYGLHLGRGRVFADLWDLERLRRCPACFPARSARLTEMNLRQRVLPPTPCPECGDGL